MKVYELISYLQCFKPESEVMLEVGDHIVVLDDIRPKTHHISLLGPVYFGKERDKYIEQLKKVIKSKAEKL